MEFGNFIALAHGSSVPLLQVGRTPRRVQMMNGDGTLLGVYTRAEHTRRTEKHSN